MSYSSYSVPFYEPAIMGFRKQFLSKICLSQLTFHRASVTYKYFIIQLMHNLCLVQCLAKNYKNGSIVSVDMGMVGVMAECSDCN